MDSGTMLNVSKKCEIPGDGEDNWGYLRTVDADGKLLKANSEKENTAFLLPITPEMVEVKKVRGVQFALSSPLTLPTELHEQSFLHYGDGVLHTPEAEITYPSRAANLLFIPHDKKNPNESRTIPACRLDFDTETRAQQGNDTVLTDEEMVDSSVYENLFSPDNMEDFISDMENVEFQSDVFKTPFPSLTGIAETCPSTPMKTSVATWNLKEDSSLCRKLEF